MGLKFANRIFLALFLMALSNKLLIDNTVTE